MIHILIVDDDAKLNKTVCTYLNDCGFETKGVLNAQKAFEELYNSLYDLIVSDIMMPQMDGFEFAQKIREVNKHIPILFMSAKDDLPSKQKGFRLGIDDYMVKPVELAELEMRVRALLRRGSDTKSAVLSLEDLTLNTTNRKVTRAGQDISLTSTEYALLEYLLRNQGQVLTRSQIADHVWNYDFSYDSHVVDVYIRYLRNKIDRAFPTKLIHTIRGTGYTLRVAP